MDQERFDQIARAVSSGASRRKVLGGAVAGIFGASVASVTGLAKGKKGGKNRKKGSKGRKKAGAEFVCTADNANAPGVCPLGSCCNSTPAGNNPACIDVITQVTSGEGGFCGNLDGQGVCRRCPEGTRCSQDPATGDIRCICNAATCDGCCIDNGDLERDDQCIVNGSGAAVSSANQNFDGSFVCGVGGSQCNVCSLGTIFSGCCTAQGACTSGTTGSNCGNSGELCEVCPQGEECGVDQTCSGDPPPGPCAAGLTECPAGSGTCVNLGTNPDDCGTCGNVCPGCSKGRTRLCNGGSCGCSAKKKKRKKRRRK